MQNKTYYWFSGDNINMTLCFQKLYIHLLKVYILSQAIWREQILSPHKSQYYFCYAYFSSWRKLQIAPDYQKMLHHAGFDSVRDKFENLFRKQVLYPCPTFMARLFLPSLPKRWAATILCAVWCICSQGGFKQSHG